MGGSTARPGLLWGTGALVAVAVLGPALLPGAVFALDATFVDHIPVPPGVWGLGPELPRRVPFGVVLAWASSGAPGAVAGRALVGLALAVAFVGAARLAVPTPRFRCPERPPSTRLGTENVPGGWVTALTAGALYALSPLVLTRVGAGQWTAVLAFAVLPWALPALLVPGQRPARTFLWAAAMGATGSVGGVLAVVAVLVGLLADRTRAAVAGAALVVVAQLPWIVPGLVVSSSGVRPPGAEAFATRADGPAGVAGLFAGHGFWRAPTQVGGDTDLGIALLGAALLGLAIVGASALPEAWRWRALSLGATGLVLALASAVPGVRGPFADLTRTLPGAPFRESQRALVLTLVWLAPAAALGAARLAAGSPAQRAARAAGSPAQRAARAAGSPAQRAARAAGRDRWLPGWAVLAAPAAAALVLAAPGLWGAGGRLRPVDLPLEWSRARQAVRAAPGTTLALPYHRHLDLPVAGDRRVLNPVPDYFGGDVISSSDPELGREPPGAGLVGPAGDRELADPREPALLRVLALARAGEPVGDALAALGVRWVVLLHAADWSDYRSLTADPGLSPAVRGPTLDLLAVGPWRGDVVDDTGRTVATESLVAPLQRLEPSPSAVWAHPAADGWFRGTSAAGRTPEGLVRVPAGRGLLWFWPSAVVLVTDLLVGAGLVIAWRSLARRKGKGPDERPPLVASAETAVR